jgi:hypothetical protein
MKKNKIKIILNLNLKMKTPKNTTKHYFKKTVRHILNEKIAIGNEKKIT